MKQEKNQPVCPTPEMLTRLITYYDEVREGSASSEQESLDMRNANEVVNALTYLESYLSNRRSYQRKLQIKRGVLMRLAREQGFMHEVDDAADALFADKLEEEMGKGDDE